MGHRADNPELFRQPARSATHGDGGTDRDVSTSDDTLSTTCLLPSHATSTLTNSNHFFLHAIITATPFYTCPIDFDTKSYVYAHSSTTAQNLPG